MMLSAYSEQGQAIGMALQGFLAWSCPNIADTNLFISYKYISCVLYEHEVFRLMVTTEINKL